MLHTHICKVPKIVKWLGASTWWLDGWQKQIGRDGISVDISRLINRANVYRFQVDGAETEKSCEEKLIAMSDGLARRLY